MPDTPADPSSGTAIPLTALNAAIAEKDTYIAELQESLRRMSTRCANLALEVSTLQTGQTALIERHAAEIARLNATGAGGTENGEASFPARAAAAEPRAN